VPYLFIRPGPARRGFGRASGLTTETVPPTQSYATTVCRCLQPDWRRDHSSREHTARDKWLDLASNA